MSKSYKGGRMVPKFEDLTYRFQNLFIDYMVGKPTVPAGEDVAPYEFGREAAREAAVAK